MYTILGIIAKPMGWLLGLLYDLIQDYGITIILFTIIVKVCIYPLYIKQTKSMSKMQDVQPKMQALILTKPTPTQPLTRPIIPMRP